MNRKVLLWLFVLCVGLGTSFSLSAQNGTHIKALSTWITSYEQEFPEFGKFTLKGFSVNQKHKVVSLTLSDNVSYFPFRPKLVARMKQEVDSILGSAYRGFKVQIYTDGSEINYFVPNYYREDRLQKDRLATTYHHPHSFVKNSSRPFEIPNGMEGRNIALWQSHGWYYEQKLDRWEWQRARVFQTVEDKYTMSYVLPYLVPMLEKAGAHVLMPRERDTQVHEVVVDNDTVYGKSTYKERGNGVFKTGGNAGFALKHTSYIDEMNPFIDGTYRVFETARANGSLVEWTPDIPEKGYYAVSVAYVSKQNSVSDAQYTVYHAGGTTSFTVDQRMGGGTWIYLGSFLFDKGVNSLSGKVVLSNQSDIAGKVVVADAVRFGGGMGNVARRPSKFGSTENVTSSSSSTAESESVNYHDFAQTSGRARYLEGARYWMQWAGIPSSVYNRSEGKNDYLDDYASRGYWVNYLNNGSVYAPDSVGLRIPIDMAMAFHTDAGTRLNDSIIGTLGIYTSKNSDKKEKYLNGQSRFASRDLTDLIMTEIVKAVRVGYEPNWSRRGMWNKSYAESRTPEVPTMLLELLSHQNFADMTYGLDPTFRFTVSRAIYKGMLKFISRQHGEDYVIQPLPVDNFAVQFAGNDSLKLSWRAVVDSLEPTADAKAYVVYTRKNEGGFDNGIVVKRNSLTIPAELNVRYGFKVTAINAGGESFPSEILAACRRSGSKGTVMVVNGFDRISAPATIDFGMYSGFDDAKDQGVPDKYELNYIGSQHEFRREKPWLDDDAPGFGASNSDYETMIVAGNSFDYPAIHGEAIVNAGFSFVSSSNEAVENGIVSLNGYPIVDLILGEQKQTAVGRGVFGWKFKTFSLNLQSKVADYCQKGGSIFVSGAYVGSDLWEGSQLDKYDIAFAQNVLKYTWRTDKASQDGQVKSVYAPILQLRGAYDFETTLNDSIYAVESPDAIEPVKSAFTVMRYGQNNMSAAVAYKGLYRTFVCGFPFESIRNSEQRDNLMYQVLNFLIK